MEFYGKKVAKAKKKSDDENEDDADEEEDDADADEEENELDINKVANVLENMQMLEWAGIKFSNKDELYQLQGSIIKFIKSKQDAIENSRFFGKICGIYNDYWILECKLSEYPEAPENMPKKQEAPGSGCNEFVYFVATDCMYLSFV